MKDNLKKFLEEAWKNEELKEKLLKITDPDTAVEQTIAVAKEYGFTLAEEDFEENSQDESDEDLSFDELEAVAGGETTYIGPGLGNVGDGCYCVIIGAAKGCGCCLVGSSDKS